MPSLEDELFEVIFERLDELTASKVACSLVGGEFPRPTLTEGLHEVEVSALGLGSGIALKDVHVRLLHYEEGIYDVEVNFCLRDSTAPSHNALVQALHHFACELAEKESVYTYFGGLDPACDEDTRLFTGRKKGPYYRLT